MKPWFFFLVEKILYLFIKDFQKLKNIDWSKVKFGLVDDNWTSDNTNHSNFHTISNALGNEIVEKSSLVPLVF